MKIIKSLFKFLLTVAIIGGVGYFGYRYYQKKKAAKASAEKPEPMKRRSAGMISS